MALSTARRQLAKLLIEPVWNRNMIDTVMDLAMNIRF